MTQNGTTPAAATTLLGVASAYKKITKHWGSMFDKFLDPQPFFQYRNWAEAVWESDSAGEIELLFHEDDRSCLVELGLSAELSQLRNIVLGGTKNQRPNTRVLPNVPQHIKGDPRTARFITILMNPGRDDKLQKLKPDLIKAIKRNQSYDPEWSKGPESANRLLEQGEVLKSQIDPKHNWDNWTEKLTLYNRTSQGVESGLGDLKFGDLKCFSEIELFPYQSKKWTDVPRPIRQQLGKLPSVELAENLLSALIDDTISSDVDNLRIQDGRSRIFVVRGVDELEYFLNRSSIHGQMRQLAEVGLLYTFPQQPRWISGRNLVQVLPNSRGEWTYKKSETRIADDFEKNFASERFLDLNLPFKSSDE